MPKGTERRSAQRLGSRRFRRRASGERLAPTGAPSRRSFSSLSAAYRSPARASWDECLGRCYLPSASPSPANSRQSGHNAARAGSRGLPSLRLRGEAAGAASGPAIRTPHDSALRRTGRIVYSPIRNIYKMSGPSKGAVMRRSDSGIGCGARGPASQAGTREAPGPRPGGIMTAPPGAGWTGTGRRWLTASKALVPGSAGLGDL